MPMSEWWSFNPLGVDVKFDSLWRRERYAKTLANR